MKPTVFGTATFADLHTEDILSWKRLHVPCFEEYIDFETVSGRYAFVTVADVFPNGRVRVMHQFRDLRRKRTADILSVGLINYEKKTAKVVFLKGEKSNV